LRGMHAVLKLFVPLCAAEYVNEVPAEEVENLKLWQNWGMGELSWYKGYEHIYDDIPDITQSLLQNSEEPLPEFYDLRDAYPACFPDKPGLRHSPQFAEVVRNQGSCGSCWAFAATTSVMTGLCISSLSANLADTLANSSDRYEISVQQIMACNPNNFGCTGGTSTAVGGAFEANKGIHKEREYPYKCGGGSGEHHFEVKNGDCTQAPWGAQCVGHDGVVPSWHYGGHLRATGEEGMMHLVASGLPSYASFKVYSSLTGSKDIYKECTGTYRGGHAVVLVGYGVEAPGFGEDAPTKYWTIQNSWGPTWGENGFKRVKRGINLCGIEGGANLLRAWVDGGEKPGCFDSEKSGISWGDADGNWHPIPCAETKPNHCKHSSVLRNCPVSCKATYCEGAGLLKRGPKYTTTTTTTTTLEGCSWTTHANTYSPGYGGSEKKFYLDEAKHQCNLIHKCKAVTCSQDGSCTLRETPEKGFRQSSANATTYAASVKCGPPLTCDDGLALWPVEECPTGRSFSRMKNCKYVGGGEFCEADGECGTDYRLDNCGPYDIYLKDAA